MNGVQALLYDLGVSPMIRQWSPAERALVDTTKASLRAVWFRCGIRFGTCFKCGTLHREPATDMCGNCGKPLSIVEPVEPAA